MMIIWATPSTLVSPIDVEWVPFPCCVIMPRITPPEANLPGHRALTIRAISEQAWTWGPLLSDLVPLAMIILDCGHIEVEKGRTHSQLFSSWYITLTIISMVLRASQGPLNTWFLGCLCSNQIWAQLLLLRVCVHNVCSCLSWHCGQAVHSGTPL